MGVRDRVVRDRARELRRGQTDAEGLLWQVLRRRGLEGYRFRRQQPIGPYIGDFVCMSERLVVELDGEQHAERRERDLERDAYLERQGFRVLRFWNREVFEDCSAVADGIYMTLSRGRRGEGRSRGRLHPGLPPSEKRRTLLSRRKRAAPLVGKGA